MKKNKLIIIRGISGSGKSTLAKKLIEKMTNASHYEADSYFYDEDGNYNFVSSELATAHELCFKATKLDLKKGKSVIVSNTSTRLWEFENYLELAKSLEVEVKVIRMNANFGNIHNVPQNIVDSMSERFEDYHSEYVYSPSTRFNSLGDAGLEHFLN
jgi:predicted kinase